MRESPELADAHLALGRAEVFCGRSTPACKAIVRALTLVRDKADALDALAKLDEACED